eukprot:5378307-Prorocentrum_lima.AAC.1
MTVPPTVNGLATPHRLSLRHLDSFATWAAYILWSSRPLPTTARSLPLCWIGSTPTCILLGNSAMT